MVSAVNKYSVMFDYINALLLYTLGTWCLRILTIVAFNEFKVIHLKVTGED